MSEFLKWEGLKVAQSSAIRVTITGNVNTRLATRYFWIPVGDHPSASKWTMQDGETLEFDTALITSGKDNRLGFVSQMVPVDANNPNLHVTFQVRQDNSILLEQHYDLLATNPNIQLSLADGISLTL